MTFTNWTPAFAEVTSFLIVMPAEAGIQVLHYIPVLRGFNNMMFYRATCPS